MKEPAVASWMFEKAGAETVAAGRRSSGTTAARLRFKMIKVRATESTVTIGTMMKMARRQQQVLPEPDKCPAVCRPRVSTQLARSSGARASWSRAHSGRLEVNGSRGS